MALLETKNLMKYFKVGGGILHAVDGVNISIDKGHSLGVVGESGCGKSTLGKTVIRLTEPSAGEIYFEGKEISNLSKKDFHNLRTEMSMIFQDPLSSLDPRMTVREIITEPLQIYKVDKTRGELYDHVEAIMEQVGIDPRFADSYPHELDGGRRQRVGIGRALALGPKFVVCDEPVSALDVSIQAQVLNLLLDLQEKNNLTYMFITHDLSVVRHISDQIVVMYLGQVVESASTKELFANTLHPYSKALLSSILEPKIGVKKEKIVMKGELSSPIDPKNECRFAPRCPFASDLCRSSCPELKDVGNGHKVACHLINK